jgi:1,6-anhydro-N-acetylmuramate kinase
MILRRALVAALPALLPNAALAFRQEDAASPIAAEYAACGGGDTHAALLAELDALFAGRPVPPELPPRLLALTRCPLCGCGVAARLDPPG